MKLLSVKLENCYGINSLDHTFDFSKSNAVLIYAPNGVMKTSFAKTCKRVSEGQEPKEEIYNRKSSFELTIDNTKLKGEEILVVEPFDPNYESQNISTLLVNGDKKKRYDAIYRNILDAKTGIVNALNKLSKIKKTEIENQFIKDLECSNIFDAIKVLAETNFGSNDFSEVQYQKIFDPKVLDLLGEPSVQKNICSYTSRYNDLIEKSPLFKKGIFNPAKAETVIKTLKREKFFEAGHKVILNTKTNQIENHRNLEEVIKREKESILSDTILQEISLKIIGGVAAVKTFQDLIEEFPEISSELGDLSRLRQILWSSYFQCNRGQFEQLLSLYEENKAELTAIEKEARLEETLWYEAYSTFSERFHVPFTMRIENHTNAILGTTAPNVTFAFRNEEGEEICFDRGRLDSLDFLSVGERRAMYLLHIIFEFKSRLAKKQKTVIVIDDIADSFDYKNKYAIIEYLKELADQDYFRLVVLTHNFDFYRTFQSRVLASAQWDNSFVAQRFEKEVRFLKGGSKDVADPFGLWKKGCKNNPEMLVSMIPFVRNLVEYRDGNSCEDYKMLTSMLHIKSGVIALKLSDLERLIGNVVKDIALEDCFDKETLVLDHIYQTANSLCEEADEHEICLEKKVTLSIAIRLKAEEFMWSQVSDKTPFCKYQTNKLYKRLLAEKSTSNSCGENFPKTRQLLERVILMTSENIHINSFMYEPLMDMSCHHLVSLYQDVKSLSHGEI